jgi:hypothetical protein
MDTTYDNRKDKIKVSFKSLTKSVLDETLRYAIGKQKCKLNLKLL